MSVLDEIMPEDEPHSQPSITTFVDGMPTFTPRVVVKQVLDNLVVGISSTPDITKSHYTVGDGTFAYHMFFAQSGMSLVDVLAMAYRNVFMWIRPQGVNSLYYDVNPNRDLAMTHLSQVLSDLVGSDASERMYADYHDERLLVIDKGNDATLYQITRSYERKHDRLTTMITGLPERYASLAPEEIFEEGVVSTVQKTPAWIDPGDFIPGVWTVDPNVDSGEQY